MKRAPKSLNASVGPWNNSRMCSPGESETSFTGKLIASLTICHSTSSGASGVANGRTTRKHTSVNGSERNSSSSSGEWRAISAGMYRPPSGASPRKTAPRNEVSGALPAVLRYLISSRRHFAAKIAAATIQETRRRYAAVLAVQPLAELRAPVRRSSASAQQSDEDNSAPQSAAEFRPVSTETLRATKPASHRRDTVRSANFVRRQMPRDTQRSLIFAAGATNDFRCRQRCQSCPKPATAVDFAQGHQEFPPTLQFLPQGIVIPSLRRWSNQAS